MEFRNKYIGNSKKSFTVVEGGTRMKKRIVAMMMVMAMATGLLAGCGDTSTGKENNDAVSEQSGGSSEADVAEEADENADPVEITWLGYYTSNITVAEDSYVENLLEDYFNVEITPVTDVTQENMDTYIASGDILDVTCYSYYLEGDYDYMYEQGLIREIPEEWLWEYYPTGMEILQEWLGEEFFENDGHLVDGKVLCTPWREGKTFNTGTIVYRRDWMENLGMEEPETLDELHDLLYAFTYNDPDGNGVDDTWGIDVIYDWWGMWPVFGAFGMAGPNYYHLNDDGTVIYNAATEDYKTALGILKEWYDEGIIHSECITDDRAAVRTKWADGRIGMMVDSETWFYSSRSSSSIIALAEDTFGENTVDVMDALTTEYGDGTVYTNKAYPTTMGMASMFFTASATDEQVIAVLKMLEGMASDHELLTKILYGEEGVDYTMNGEQLVVNSGMTVEDKAAKGIDFTYYGAGQADDTVANLPFSERDLANIEKTQSFPCIYNQNFASTYNSAYDEYQSEVSKLVKEYYHNVLLGTDNLESGWDQYISNLNSAGLDKIIAEYEEVLK